MTSKPKKPYRDFPLYAHRNGQWAKRIRGKVHYFGKWNDWEGALNRYLEDRDALMAGREPQRDAGITVGMLCNRFLTAKQRLVDAGDMGLRSWHNYRVACDHIVAQLGGRTPVSSLTVEDFAALRSRFATGRGPYALALLVRCTRTLFRFAFESHLVPTPVALGPTFKPPSKSVLRRLRQSRPRRMLEADQVRVLLARATQPMQAMIYLAINGGFGQEDCASLPRRCVDLKSGWIDFPRPKTAVSRLVPLWPETIASLELAMPRRPSPRRAEDRDLVFLTTRRNRFVRTLPTGSHVDTVAIRFNRLLESCGFNRRGLNFYALRHTFETIAGGTRDQIAVNSIMGHADNSMSDHYREYVERDRLVAVTDHVRSWLIK